MSRACMENETANEFLQFTLHFDRIHVHWQLNGLADEGFSLGFDFCPPPPLVQCKTLTLWYKTYYIVIYVLYILYILNVVLKKALTCQYEVRRIHRDNGHLAVLFSRAGRLDGSRHGKALRLQGQRDTWESLILTRRPGWKTKVWPVGGSGAGCHWGRGGMRDRGWRRAPGDRGNGLAWQWVGGRRRQGGWGWGWHDGVWGSRGWYLSCD